ncbi:MAG: dNTP triphosphohydrolase [Lachnospiraceae bacterium]|nr:dNTP triphosphohydrolase [Ruminococcus sp.]MCM1276611.1 dNTP triphosphohydrolase [Lachnospiraceae bacterium]
MSTNDYFRFSPLEHTTRESTSTCIDYRTEYARDYARVLHSPSFRRLQGKTQLFPTQESDFFRNRLTHSLEVSQIAKSIAVKMQKEYPTLDVVPEVCEIAGLIHDIGHPPFGHNGEAALDDCMFRSGGFEGNAQTLHIITRLEKKELPKDGIPFNKDGDDCRYGLNLTARVIASAIKYDNEIPLIRDRGNYVFQKGYYASEATIVKKVKDCLTTSEQRQDQKFKTIECGIMDIADDIAYSTYDVEDAFKAGFLSPYDMLAVEDDILKKISDKLYKSNIQLSPDECRKILVDIFRDTIIERLLEDQKKAGGSKSKNFNLITLNNLVEFYRKSKRIAADGYFRTDFTSTLVNKFINGVKIDINEDCPILSHVYLDDQTLHRVNVLKHFSYVALINSSRLKVAENRGAEIIKNMFKKLNCIEGSKLLPEDTRELYEMTDNAAIRARVVCDFIAGMTDRYAIEFYGRLFSENPQSIFKPL